MTTSSTISPFPIVQQGDRNHPVKTLQYLLRERAQCRRMASSARQPMQRCAFQQEKNLAVDGDVGPKTWAALIVTVRSGSRGDAVRGVQEEFQFRAGEPGQGLQVDGIFGPKTDAAVGASSRRCRSADGIVGPKTWHSSAACWRGDDS